MKVLLINGSPHKNGCTNEALCEVAGALNKNGVETVMVHVGTAPVAGCIGCGNCGKTFTATRSDAKYCCDECRYEGHLKGQRIRNEARRNKEKSNNE